MLLRVRDVVAGYGGNRVLHGVSLEVARGEVVALIGANGAGKTTLIRAISGLIPLSAGEIHLEGRRIDGLPPHAVVRLGIAQVPEGRLIFGRMTVEQNLLLGAYTRPQRPERQRMLEEVYALFPRLRERRRQAAGTLSGGEQQMCAIARALMSRPRLLILDEPSLGLSPLLVEQVFALIRRIREAGMTILLVEQNVREALEMCDRGYVLQTGRIVEEGSGAGLLGSEAVKRAYLGL